VLNVLPEVPAHGDHGNAIEPRQRTATLHKHFRRSV
jgi:hypothetical protein